MSRPLRVLIVEDSEDDTLLLVRELRRGGYDPEFQRVETADAMNAALEEQKWDVVLADYAMPHFDAIGALELFKEKGREAPFIIVSGAINEETAVAAMKAGARDYITKDKLVRLIPAIVRELRDADVRRMRKQAEQALLEAHDKLELRVEERTAELTKANQQLKREIEERKRAEKDLKLSEAKYRLLFNNDPNPLFLVDLDSGKIIDANKPATASYQYSRKEIIGMPFPDLLDADEAERIWEDLKDSHKDVYVFIPRVPARKNDGRRFFIHLHASAVQFEDERSENPGRSLIVRTVDITRRLEQEALIAQGGKMATLGEMATGVAHELNQPLNVIQVGTDYLAKMIKRGETISREKLLKISLSFCEQVNRATRIVNHLRDFGRKSDLEVYPVDLNEPIRDVFMLVGEQLKLRNIKLNLKLEEGLPAIMADKNRLEQVFLNLVVNARHAMEARGPEAIKELTIATYREGDRVLAEVSDTGTGMPKEIQKKIFDPFFTTKEPGKGTGLGLSITYNLVKDFKGDIDVRSALGVGTTFTTSFPISQKRGDSSLNREGD